MPGASRFRAARGRHSSRATRHAMGKRLCERPAVAPAETQSFDASSSSWWRNTTVPRDTGYMMFA